MSSFYSRPLSSDEIFHYGIMGMHWGIRRFQPYPKGYKGKGKVIGEAAKASKQQSGQGEGVSEEEYAAEKERVLRSGSASEVLRYKGQISNQELQNAVNRINLETRLRDISAKEKTRGLDRIDKSMKTIASITGWATIGIGAWNTIANVWNSSNQQRVYNTSTKKWEWVAKKGAKVLNTIKTGS